MKDALKTVGILLAICFVVTAVLAGVNALTAPIIRDAREAAQMASLSAVVPGAVNFEEIALPDTAPKTVTALYRETEGRGFAALLETSSAYSNSPMGITAGFTAEGAISGITLTNYQESKDFGKTTYPETYIGKDAGLEGVELVSGVTYSSTAFKNAIGDAFTALIDAGCFSGSGRREEKLNALLPKLLPGCVSVEGTVAIEPLETLPDDWSAGYVAANRCGYVALLDTDEGTKVCVIDGYNCAVAVDLDGNSVDASLTRPAMLHLEKVEQHTAAVKAILGEDAVVTTLTEKGLFSTVTGIYTAEQGDKSLYAVVAAPISGGTAVQTVWLINEAGTVVAVRVGDTDDAAVNKLIVNKAVDSLTAETVTGLDAELTAVLTRAAADVSAAVSRMML